MLFNQFNQVSHNFVHKFNVVLVTIFSIFYYNCDLVSCSRNSNFLSAPTTVTARENDTVVLPCIYEFPIQFTRWFFNDNPLADTRDNQISSKYQLWQNGSLQVNNVRATDTGDYACEVMTKSGVLDSQMHSIEVQYPPKVVSSMNGMIDAKIGTIFDIMCEASGVPTPIIHWRHNGKNVTEQFKHTPNYLVEVNNMNKSGSIECVADNGVGEPAVSGIFLIVLFQPKVSAVTHFVHTKVGLRANLECEVISAPAAKVFWFHRNAPIIPDQRTSKSESDLNPNRTAAYYHSRKKHTLIIKSVRETDLGMYECKAENEIGIKNAYIELAGRPMPSIFKASPVASLPTTHNLIWTTESFSPIIEYSLKFRQVPSGNILPENRHFDSRWKELTIPGETTEGPLHSIGYTLKGLLPGSVYEIAVASRNKYGWSDISKIIGFHTNAEGQTATYPSEVSQYGEIETNYLDVNEEIPPYLDRFESGTSTTHFYSITLLATSSLFTSFCISKLI